MKIRRENENEGRVMMAKIVAATNAYRATPTKETALDICRLQLQCHHAYPTPPNDEDDYLVCVYCDIMKHLRPLASSASNRLCLHPQLKSIDVTRLPQGDVQAWLCPDCPLYFVVHF